MVKIEIKIAGVISTMDNIHDIENLAKLFVMEHRINNLQSCKETKKIIGETHLEFAKKSTVFSNFIHGKLPILTVKGLE